MSAGSQPGKVDEIKRQIETLNLKKEDLEDNVDFLQYDSTEEEDSKEAEAAYITIDDDEDWEGLGSHSVPYKDIPFPETISLSSVKLECGDIRLGDTVELKDETKRASGRLLSGDFLRVKEIVEDIETRDIKLRGQLFRRNAYQRPLFVTKELGDMNEVFMLLNVKTNDPRPYKAQGLAEVDTKQVIAKRELIITDAPYPLASFRDTKPRLPRDMTRQEASEFLFKNGRLVCRCVYIVVLSNNGKSYEGEVRCVYKSECDRLPDQDVISKTGAQDPPQKSGHHLHSHDDVVELDPATAQKKPRPPHKSRMYTFGDCFCGAGIASQGAVHAGLKVVWGLEKFSVPMQAFRENHPNAIDLELDAEDFKEFVNRKNFAVDILHFSCPCQFWSEAHTVDGKNDWNNIKTILIPGPVAEKLKAPILTFEQAAGFLKYEKHKVFFRNFLASLMCAGYKVRYKVVDFIEFGVPQRRKRLLIVAAKKGIPLPAFPRPTHGPPGSGLKPYATIYDGLLPLQNIDLRYDKYHDPDSRVLKYPRESYDPKKRIAYVITCDGGAANYHPSGERKFTERESACLQGCPPDFHLTGAPTEAMRQAGNGFPCLAAEALFLSCAQTLEAFHHGYIGPEDEIDDLYETLLRKGIDIPQDLHHSRPLFESSSSRQRGNQNSAKFRYLNRLVRTKATKSTLNLWSRKLDLSSPEPERRRKRPAPAGFGLIDEPDDDDTYGSAPGPSNLRRVRSRLSEDKDKENSFWQKYQGKVIELD